MKLRITEVQKKKKKGFLRLNNGFQVDFVVLFVICHLRTNLEYKIL